MHVMTGAITDAWRLSVVPRPDVCRPHLGPAHPDERHSAAVSRAGQRRRHAGAAGRHSRPPQMGHACNLCHPHTRDPVHASGASLGNLLESCPVPNLVHMAAVSAHQPLTGHALTSACPVAVLQAPCVSILQG